MLRPDGLPIAMASFLSFFAFAGDAGLTKTLSGDVKDFGLAVCVPGTLLAGALVLGRALFAFELDDALTAGLALLCALIGDFVDVPVPSIGLVLPSTVLAKVGGSDAGGDTATVALALDPSTAPPLPAPSCALDRYDCIATAATRFAVSTMFSISSGGAFLSRSSSLSLVSVVAAAECSASPSARFVNLMTSCSETSASPPATAMAACNSDVSSNGFRNARRRTSRRVSSFFCARRRAAVSRICRRCSSVRGGLLGFLEASAVAVAASPVLLAGLPGAEGDGGIDLVVDGGTDASGTAFDAVIVVVAAPTNPALAEGKGALGFGGVEDA